MTAVLTKVTVPTVLLRDLVSRAVKGSTNVDLIPMSSLMQVKVQDGKMSVKTTDNVNYLSVYADVECENFEMVVPSKLFSQTISKITSVDTAFIIDGTKVTIEANGKYNIKLMVDADGNPIEFKELKVVSPSSVHHLNLEEIKSILSLNKTSKADKTEVPGFLGNYYVDSKGILTSNYYKACFNPLVISDNPLLISSTVMDLVLAVADDSGVDSYLGTIEDALYIVFESTIGSVFGRIVTDVSEYPASDLFNLISNPLSSFVNMNRTLFIQAVDRMCLFTDGYEENKLTLTFTSEGLKLYADKTDSTELVSYISVDTPIETPITLSVNGEFLKTQLTSCNKEELIVRFNEGVGLQMFCGNVVLMLGILDVAA